MNRQASPASSSLPSSSGDVLCQLKSIHFKLVTALQRLKEELSRSNADVPSTHANAVKLLGAEFRAVLEQAGQEMQASVAVHKVVRDFQGVLNKAERMLTEARQKRQRGQRNAPGVGTSPNGAAGGGGTQSVPMTGEERDSQEQKRVQAQEQHDLALQHAIDANDAIVRERDAAMVQISSQIGDVHQIFVDLAGLVSEQGGQVDDIESNIDRSKQRTEAGIAQIRHAEKKGKKGRCNVFFMTGLAALVVLVLFVVLMA